VFGLVRLCAIRFKGWVVMGLLRYSVAHVSQGSLLIL